LDSLPVNLWGRDVLEGMGDILCNPNSMVSHQMFQQGYNPLRGLGKYQQGWLGPVQTKKSRKDRARILGRIAFSVGALVQQIKHSPFKPAAQINRSSLGGPVALTEAKLAAITALVEE
jgi:hypothetical protein